MNQELFKQILQNAFLTRRAANPRYSLRSFARRLELAPPAVSEILRGKRQVSRKMGQRIIDVLGVTPEQKKELFESRTGEQQTAGSPPYATFAMDAYSAIAEWHFFAILSLAEMPDFDGTPPTIAKRLNISEGRAERALEVLERLGLLKRDESGDLAWTGKNFTTSEDIQNLSVRRSHHEGLELAGEALVHQPLDEREFTAITMAVDPDRIPEAKRMIREFRDQLSTFLERGNRRRVFRLGIQLFSLSDNRREFNEIS